MMSFYLVHLDSLVSGGDFVGLVTCFDLASPGRWILEELLRQVQNSPSIRIVVAGRSASRIRSLCEATEGQLNTLIRAYCLRTKCGEWLPVLECDSGDEKAMVKAFSQAKTIISAVGPFNRLGLPVIEACLKARSNCVDIRYECETVEKLHFRFEQNSQW
jgi:short subunit dehydrogenase-like uncharacterized protein